MKEMNIEQVDGTQLSANGQLPKFVNAFTVPELNKNYIMYTCDEFVYPNSENVNEMNIKKVYVSEIVNEANGISLVGITDDNEWKQVVASMIKVKSGEIQGIRINVSTPMKLKGKRHIGLKNDNIEALSAVAITEEPAIEAAPVEQPAPATPVVENPAPVVESVAPQATLVMENTVTPAPTPEVAPAQTPIVEAPATEPQVIVSESQIIEEPVLAPKKEVVEANTVNNIDDTNVFNNATGPVVDALREGQVNVAPTPVYEEPQKVEITESVVPEVSIPTPQAPQVAPTPSVEPVVTPEIPESAMPTFNEPSAYAAPAVENPAPVVESVAPQATPVMENTATPAPTPEVNYFDSPEVSAPRQEASLSFPEFESAPASQPVPTAPQQEDPFSAMLNNPITRAQFEAFVRQIVVESVEKLGVGKAR